MKTNINFILIPAFVTAFAQCNNFKLKIIVFDHFLADGVCAIFRTGLVLFKMVEAECKNIKEITDFIVAYDKAQSQVIDIKEFKQEVERLYLDCKLLENLRA